MPTFLKQPWQRFQTAFTALEAWYRGVLHHILEHERKRVMAGAVALLVVSLFVLTQIGQEFTPTSDQSQFTLRVNAPRSESVTAAGQDLEAVRAALAEVPGVLHVYQRSDTQDANFFVQLVPKADRDRTQDEIVRDCRARVNALAGFQADVTIGYDKPVALSITGDDAAQLEAISHEVEGVLRTIPGVRDVTSSVRTGASELKIVRNDAMANELGVTPAAIGETLGTMLQFVKVNIHLETNLPVCEKHVVHAFSVCLVLPLALVGLCGSLPMIVFSPCEGIVEIFLLVRALIHLLIGGEIGCIIPKGATFR